MISPLTYRSLIFEKKNTLFCFYFILYRSEYVIDMSATNHVIFFFWILCDEFFFRFCFSSQQLNAVKSRHTIIICLLPIYVHFPIF